MPELPEVQVIVDELNRSVLRLPIRSVDFLRENILRSTKVEIAELLVGNTFRKIRRIGKYIRFECGTGELIAHLRMTGKFVYSKNNEPTGPHDRLIINFTDGSKLIFNDIRTLGTIEVHKSEKLPKKLMMIGIDPFDEGLTESYLYTALNVKNVPVKNFLMNQKNIGGLGNIYCSEILFHAGISPLKRTSKISKTKAKKLLTAMKVILETALLKNGTTISDFRRVDDKTGEFQNFLKVYGKESKPCINCGNPISRITQQQRSTFYCMICQK